MQGDFCADKVILYFTAYNLNGLEVASGLVCK